MVKGIIKALVIFQVVLWANGPLDIPGRQNHYGPSGEYQGYTEIDPYSTKGSVRKNDRSPDGTLQGYEERDKYDTHHNDDGGEENE